MFKIMPVLTTNSLILFPSPSNVFLPPWLISWLEFLLQCATEVGTRTTHISPEILQKRIQLFTFSQVAVLGFSQNNLTNSEESFYSQLTALMKRCWILSNAFSTPNKMCVVFIFNSINTVYYMDFLHYWINLTLSCYTILFICCWIHFASRTCRIFAFISLGDTALYRSYNILSGFGISLIPASHNQCLFQRFI